MSNYIEEQADLLFTAYDSHLVPFFDEGAPMFREGYAGRATEAMHDIGDSEAILLQIVLASLNDKPELEKKLASLNDKPELAKKLAEQYREPLKAVAVTMIKAAIERSNSEDAA